MTFEEKRTEVTNRLVRSRLYDAETCTSIEAELFSLLYHGGTGVSDWDESELDAYLAEHDQNGQSVDEFDEDEG